MVRHHYQACWGCSGGLCVSIQYTIVFTDTDTECSQTPTPTPTPKLGTNTMQLKALMPLLSSRDVVGSSSNTHKGTHSAAHACGTSKQRTWVTHTQVAHTRHRLISHDERKRKRKREGGDPHNMWGGKRELDAGCSGFLCVSSGSDGSPWHLNGGSCNTANVKKVGKIDFLKALVKQMTYKTYIYIF